MIYLLVEAGSYRFFPLSPTLSRAQYHVFTRVSCAGEGAVQCSAKDVGTDMPAACPRDLGISLWHWISGSRGQAAGRGEFKFTLRYGEDTLFSCFLS